MGDRPAPPAHISGIAFENILLCLHAARLRQMTGAALAELMFEAQILAECAARWIAESPKTIERAAHKTRLLQELSRPSFQPNTDLCGGLDPEMGDLPHLIGMGGYWN